MQKYSAARLDPFSAPQEASPKLDLLLTSGGDERIALDPVARRNRYGTTAHPKTDEIWFSSSTASAISERGYAAARRAFEKYLGGSPNAGGNLVSWFDELRARITAIAGVRGAETILCASGTEAEILALAMAKALLPRPLTNIVVARDETGNGVMQAAAGAHFDQATTFQSSVEKGGRLRGWEKEQISTSRIEIRDETGALRAPRSVDQDTFGSVERAIASGNDILLHVMDASKTGRGGPTRSAARKITKRNPGRVVVVVDACQLRCSFDDIRADLDDGFLVMITGSKFAGGPPFCGAILIPPQHVERLCNIEVPLGLSAYSAQLDWPATLRASLDESEFSIANLGLGLRWEAALSEIEAFAAITAERRRDITLAFGDEVRRCVAAQPLLRILDSDRPAYADRAPTIFPVVTGDGDAAAADRIYRALRLPLDDNRRHVQSNAASSICHVGQPVVVGGCSALRVCISMPTMNFIASRLNAGMSLEDAMAPTKSALDTLFRKWGLLAQASN